MSHGIHIFLYHNSHITHMVMDIYMLLLALFDGMLYRIRLPLVHLALTPYKLLFLLCLVGYVMAQVHYILQLTLKLLPLILLTPNIFLPHEPLYVQLLLSHPLTLLRHIFHRLKLLKLI